MSDCKLTSMERETIILWNEANDIVDIETYETKLIRILRKAAKEYPDKCCFIGENQYGGMSFELPRSLLRISFMKPISEETHRMMSERAKAQNRIERMKKNPQ